jgi:hypothetical protein
MMRTTQTFILRLFVDTEADQALRGALQAISDNEVHTFTDEQALLALLHRITSREFKEEKETSS